MLQKWLVKILAISNLGWCSIALIWLCGFADFRPLKLPDEGRYIGVAWEMLSSGSWAIPLLDGMPYFHKPPLFYWLTAFSLKLFGFHLLSARFASLFAAILLALTLLWFITRHLSRNTAVLALLALLTQPFFFTSAQFANMDMLVASMISLTVIFAFEAIVQAEKSQSYRWFLVLAFVCAALGVLSKGLIGIVLPAGVIFFWLLATRRLLSLRWLFWLPGWLLFIALSAPWFIDMEQHYKGFLGYFFVHHHLQRFAGTAFNNQQPFWFYIPALLALTMPWSLWLFTWRPEFFSQLSAPAKEIAALMFCWLLFILIFFSIPTSKPLGYIMPVLPAFATLIAMMIMHQSGKLHAFSNRVIISLGLAILTCVLAISLVIQHEKKTPSYIIAKHFQSQVSPNDQLVMIGKYQFDLPLYWQLNHPAWVVSDWKNKDILKHDNWKKELFEARLFNPTAGDTTLLSVQSFAHQLCLSQPHAVWIVGDDKDMETAQMLHLNSPLFVENHSRLWHLDSVDVQAYCQKHAH